MPYVQVPPVRATRRVPTLTQASVGPMAEQMAKPVEGDQVRTFNSTTGEYNDVLGSVTAIINRGIYGWIVELSGMLFVEVVPEPDSSVFREIMPKERRSRAI